MISDEQIMAYVDGELDAQAHTEVERAMDSDPEIARRIARQRALREKLRDAFDDVLREPVPERLLAAARSAPVGAPLKRPEVADLGHARERRTARELPSRRWSWPEWSAIAASVVVGALVADLLWRLPEPAPFAEKNGRLVAQAELASALTTQLANTQSADAATRVGVSFRSKSGDYCRTFVTRAGGGLAGLACRQNDAWSLQVLARVNAGSTAAGPYSPAGSPLPPAVLQAVEEQIAGEPLDAAAEALAQRNGWQK
jgi:hypothetical protein